MSRTEQEQVEQVGRYMELLHARLAQQVGYSKRLQTIRLSSLLTATTCLVLSFVTVFAISAPVASIVAATVTLVAVLGSVTTTLLGWRAESDLSQTIDRLRSLMLRRELQLLHALQGQVMDLAGSLAHTEPEKYAEVTQIMAEIASLGEQLAVGSTPDKGLGRTGSSTSMRLSTAPEDSASSTSRTAKLVG